MCDQCYGCEHNLTHIASATNFLNNTYINEKGATSRCACSVCLLERHSWTAWSGPCMCATSVGANGDHRLALHKPPTFPSAPVQLTASCILQSSQLDL